MTTDLTRRDSDDLPAIFNPATGETIDRTARTGDLAAMLRGIRDLEQQLRSTKAELSDELLSRMDRSASWTLREDGWEIVGESPAAAVTYDPEALRVALRGLVRKGLITREAAAGAVVRPPAPAWQVSKRGLAGLIKLGGQVADTIALVATPVGQGSRSIKKVERLFIDGTVDDG
jgi:hypothetical protein